MGEKRITARHFFLLFHSFINFHVTLRDGEVLFLQPHFSDKYAELYIYLTQKKKKKGSAPCRPSSGRRRGVGLSGGLWSGRRPAFSVRAHPPRRHLAADEGEALELLRLCQPAACWVGAWPLAGAAAIALAGAREGVAPLLLDGHVLDGFGGGYAAAAIISHRFTTSSCRHG